MSLYSIPNHDALLLAGSTDEDERHQDAQLEAQSAALRASPSFVLEAIANDVSERAEKLAAAIIDDSAINCLSALRDIVGAYVDDVWAKRNRYYGGDPAAVFAKADREAATPRCPVESALNALATHDYGRAA